MDLTLLKIGGSVKDYARMLISHLSDHARKKNRRMIIVPGGGPFADAVRNNTKGVSEETAHWMAILAMHQYGLFLSDGKIPTIESLDELEEDLLCILLPYRIMRDDDTLPRNWSVTSDTISAFIASNLGLKKMIKVTDVDGIFIDGHLRKKMRSDELSSMIAGYGCFIDGEFPKILRSAGIRCIVVNGKFPDRVIKAIEDEEAIYTEITP